MTDAVTELRCQARRTGAGHVCGRRISAVSGRAVPTMTFLRDLRQVAPGEHGVWCPRCRVVTVYRVVEARVPRPERVPSTPASRPA